MKALDSFVRREIKSIGQIREDYLRRMTRREVSFKYDWHYCPQCHYFYLPGEVTHPCDQLSRMENPVVWINEHPYLFEHQFAEEYPNVEKVLQTAF